MKLTIKDIARLAGTSTAAVSMVLNRKDRNRIGPEKRQAILSVVEKHGYRPRAAAKALTLNRSFRIGVCISGTLERHPVVGETSTHNVLSLAADRICRAEYGMSLVQIDPAQPMLAVARRLVREEVDGFVFVNFPADYLDRILFSLSEHGIPAVALGTIFADPNTPYSWAAVDRQASFRAGTRHWLEQGLTRIAMLDVDIRGVFGQAKRSGYESAMRASGLDPLPAVSIRAATAKAARQAVLDLLRLCPDTQAIVLTDNFLAPVVQMALDNRPVSLLGFGDGEYAELCDPPIPYMRLPMARLAEQCVDHLFDWIADPAARVPLRRLVQCDLVR